MWSFMWGHVLDGAMAVIAVLPQSYRGCPAAGDPTSKFLSAATVDADFRLLLPVPANRAVTPVVTLRATLPECRLAATTARVEPAVTRALLVPWSTCQARAEPSAIRAASS